MGDISAFIRSPFFVSPPSIDFRRSLARSCLDDDSRHILWIHGEDYPATDPTINSYFLHSSEDYREDLMERNESS